MAVLSLHALVDRVYDVIEAKFDIHKVAIASDVEPIRQMDTIESDSPKGSPSVSVLGESGEGMDSPQTSGSDKEWRIRVVSVFSLPYLGRAHVRPVHKFATAMEYTLQMERDLLHPTTGAELDNLHHIWPESWRITWGRGARFYWSRIEHDVRAWVGENESY